MTDRFLLLKEVAERCRMSLSTVRYWVTKDRLRSTRPGRRHLVSERDLEAFLARHARGPGPLRTSE